MTRLDKTTESVATHLLLMGQTKAGKTHYAAQAAKDGYELLYLDSDHGYATLKQQLKDFPEAMSRVHYLRLPKPKAFLWEFVQTKGFICYSEKLEGLFLAGVKHNDNDELVLIRPSRIPPNVIVVMDSWSGIASNIVDECAEVLGVDARTAKANTMRPVYGNAGRTATMILKILQFAPFKIITIAHPDMYELKTKPPGKGKIKEDDMEILKTIQIPLSTSKPHGYSIGKYFTDIGNLRVTATGESELSFKREELQISGGTIGIIGRGKAVQFAALFGEPPKIERIPTELPWIEYLNYEEFCSRRTAGTLNKLPVIKQKE